MQTDLAAVVCDNTIRVKAMDLVNRAIKHSFKAIDIDSGDRGGGHITVRDPGPIV
jgi:N-acetylglutamate synthase/N-acetylornithine aminotransferase